jgi:hypothetical protein
MIKNRRDNPNMTDQNELKAWIRLNHPIFWSLLNRRAQTTLPKGLIEYIDVSSPSEITTRRDDLTRIERYLAELKTLCGRKTVDDNYRRSLSGVDSYDRLAELFSEIALCASIGKLSGKLKLHPPTGKGTYSDCCFYVHSYEVYGEIKRYADSWPHIGKPGEVDNDKVPYKRSIAKKPSGEKSHDTARPRSMDLKSKLRCVYRQFPERCLNILFIFHPGSFGEEPRYIKQALFGDSNFFRTEDEIKLEPDGLFSIDEWRNISACCLARFKPDSKVIYYPLAWENPHALTAIPRPVLEALR